MSAVIMIINTFKTLFFNLKCLQITRVIWMVIYQSLKLSNFTLSLKDVSEVLSPPPPFKKVKPTYHPFLPPQKIKIHIPSSLRKEKHIPSPSPSEKKNTPIKRVKNGRVEAKEAPNDTWWWNNLAWLKVAYSIRWNDRHETLYPSACWLFLSYLSVYYPAW